MPAGVRELTREELRGLLIASPFPPESTRFFAFDRGSSPETWDIIGIWERHSDPLLLTMLFLHFDQVRVEHLRQLYASRWSQDDPPGDPPSHLVEVAAGNLEFSPNEYLRLIELLEGCVGQAPDDAEPLRMYFEPVPATPLERILPITPESLYGDDSYRYHADAGVPTAAEHIAVLSLPGWEERDGTLHVGWLGLTVFERARFDEPYFDPFLEQGLGYITVNAPALRDLIALLTRHAYRAE